MGVDLPLETNAQLAKACKPRMRALNHPAVTPEPLAAFNAAPRDAHLDTSLAQCLAAFVVVIALVGMNPVRSLSRSALQTCDGLHGIEQWLKKHRVVPVSSAYQDCQGNTTCISQNVALAAELAPVGRVRACVLAPRGLETLAPSILARLQSIWSYWRSRWSSA